jgi:autotransporter translocation and assembly factor TamB
MRRGLLALAILIAILIAGLAVFIQTPAARDYIRRQALNYLNESFEGQFRAERLEGSLLWGITLHNVALRYRDADVLRVATISIDYSVIGFILGRIDLARIETDQAKAYLEQDARNEWNLLAALKAKHPALETGPSTLRLTILNLVLKDSSIEVAEGAGTYRIDPISAEVYLNIDGSAVDARVRRVAFQLTAPDLPALIADGGFEYRRKGAAASLTIPALTLIGGQSEMRIAGAISDLNTLDCDETVSIDRLAASEIRRYVPNWAGQQNVSGTVKVHGPQSDFNANADLLVAGGKITAQAKADLSGRAPHFAGTLIVAGFDVGKAIEGNVVGGVIDAKLKGQSVGTSLDMIEADTNLSIRDPQVGGLRSRLIAIKAGLRRSVVTIEAELTGGAGRAIVRGSVDVARARTYDLALSLDHLDLRKVASRKPPIDTNLNLSAKLTGRGFDLAKARARVDLTLLPSMAGPVRLESGRFGATIADRRVRAHLSLSSNNAELDAGGAASLASDRHLNATYKVQVADIAPWAALAGAQGGGSLDLSGSTVGTLDHIRAQGQALFAGLSYGTNYVGCGSATVNLSEVAQPQMHGSVAVSMREVQSSIRLKTLDLTASLARLRPVTVATISIKARDELSLSDQIDAEFHSEPSRHELTLKRISIQDPHQTWTNPSPARFVADANGFAIHRFELASRETHILLDGRTGTTGAQDLLLRIDKFPLSALKEALPPNINLKGSLSVQTRITGNAASPTIHATSTITGLTVAGQSYQGLDISAGYGGEQAGLALAFRQDSDHVLTANGTVPVALSWANGFVMKPRGDIDFRATSSGLSLVFLDAAAAGMLRNAKGSLTVNLALTGPVANPVPSGSIAIRDGAAIIAPVGVRIDDLELSTNVTSDLIRLGQLRIASGQGTIIGSGQLGLDRYKPGNVELTIHFSKWPAIGNRQYRATVDGQVEVAGAALAPKVSGKIEIINAVVRPDLGFLTSRPPPPDPTIRLVSSAPAIEPSSAEGAEYACAQPRKPPLKASAEPAEKEINAAQSLGLDVGVRLRRDIWIKEENGSAELSGDLRVSKSGTGPVRVVGEIDAVRGWMTVMSKMFTVSSAKVTFSGGSPIDPALDVTADYQAPQYVVHVIIGGTVSAPTLTFKSDPGLEQADILSVLMFGRPASQLSGGESTDLKSKTAELASGYAASEVGRQLNQALGLEQMGIEFRQTDTGVGIGSYMGENTYATFSQDLTQQGGQRIDLNHYLTRHWQIDTNTTSSGNRGADLIWSTSY